MALIELLAHEPVWFACSLLPLGLIVGSFLNVVIHRLPKMLERDWDFQARDYLGLESAGDGAAYNLVTPPSSCPHCSAKVRARHNVPVISYLILRGRCADCGASIAWRYPAVEILTGLMTMAVAFEFGFGWHAAGAILLTWALIALAGIDLETLLLPDAIVLPMLWAGLLFNIAHGFVPATAAILGAACGYLSLWLVYHSFRLATGKEGMGHGDFKLLALLGAWLGLASLPAIILISSVLGAVTGVALIAFTKHETQTPLPFGPFLAAAGWVSLMWGDELMRLYLAGFAAT